MATSKLQMRLRGNESKPRTIELLFRYADTNIKYSTGIKLLPNQWDNKREKIKQIAVIGNRDELNRRLNHLKLRSLEIFSELNSKSGEVSKDLLKEAFNREFRTQNKGEKKNQASPFIVEYLDRFIEEAPQRVVRRAKTIEPLKRNTIKNYKLTLNQIKQFNTYSSKRWKFEDLSLDFHKQLVNFLSDTQGYSKGTISTRIKDLKSIANHAKRDGIEVNNDVFTPQFYKPVEAPKDYDDVYLNLDEIQKVVDYPFDLDSLLDRARDWFVIGLWTGQRVSDFLNLTSENFDKDYIRLTQQKTKRSVVIPIHSDIKDILSKRNGLLPKRISPQKFNMQIKEVCRLVGINELTKGTKVINKRKTEGMFPKHELIASHTCRRSFATNHYGRLSNYNLMNITGHKTESSFLQYLKITSEESANALLNLWKS